MTQIFTEDDTVAAIAWLTHSRLDMLVSAALVAPLQTDAGRLYRPVDLARLALLCDLAEQFDLTEDALAIVMSLVDALHTARFNLHCVAAALAAEPAKVQERVAKRFLSKTRNDPAHP